MVISRNVILTQDILFLKRPIYTSYFVINSKVTTKLPCYIFHSYCIHYYVFIVRVKKIQIIFWTSPKVCHCFVNKNSWNLLIISKFLLENYLPFNCKYHICCKQSFLEIKFKYSNECNALIIAYIIRYQRINAYTNSLSVNSSKRTQTYSIFNTLLSLTLKSWFSLQQNTSKIFGFWHQTFKDPFMRRVSVVGAPPIA